MAQMNLLKRLNGTRKDQLFDLVLIILPLTLLVIAPVMWYQGSEGSLILCGDTYFPVDPHYGLKTDLFVWQNQYGGGSYNYLSKDLPFFLTVRVLNQFLPLWLTQLALFLVLTIITFLSFFFLAKTVLTLSRVACSKTASLVSSVLSAFLYTFNPYMLNIWYMQYLDLIFFVAFLPLAIACFLILIDRLRFGKPGSIKWLLLSFFASIPLLATDLPDFLLFVVLVLFLAMCYLVAVPRNRKLFLLRFAKYFGFFGVLIFLANLWWLPNYFIYSFSYPQIDWRLVGDTPTYFFKLYTQPSNFAELFRLVGDIDFYTPNRIPAGNVYITNPVFILIGFIIPALSLISLLHRKQEKKIHTWLLVYSFVLVYLASLAFTSGVNLPFGGLNIQLFEHVSILQVFRAPWRRLMGFALLSLCVLFAFSLHKFKRPRINMGIKVLALVMVILFAWPQVSGEIFSHTGIPTTNGIALEPALAKVPQYYYSAANYINEQTEAFSVMFLPFYPFYSSLSWGLYASWYPLNIFQKPIVNLGITGQQPSGNIERVFESVFNEFYTAPSPSDGKILGSLFNVKYVLLLKDWDTQYEPFFVARLSPDDIAKLLPAAGFSLEKTYGNVSIYRNSYWTKDTSVYAANFLVNDKQQYDQTMLYYEDAYSILDSKASVVFMQPENELKSQPTFINYTQSIMLTVDQASLWSSNCAVLSDDANTKMNGNNSLQILVANNSKQPFWWINYNFEKNQGSAQDLSGYDYISFYWYGQNTGATIILCLYATYPNRYEITFVDNFVGWKYMAFPLSEFVAYGSPSLNDVNQLQFYCSTQYTSGTWYVDMIELESGLPVQISELQGTQPQIVATQIDPTKYVVEINAADPFILVLGQSFSPYWQISVNGESTDFKHYLVNGYQNGWFINETGNYSIKIEYWPQNLFYFGLTLSSLTMAVCAFVLVMYVNRKKIKRNRFTNPLSKLWKLELQ
jgi:hypothetical protein